MTDHNYEAEVETERGKFTFRGDDAMMVSGLAPLMAVQMYAQQVEEGYSLDIPVGDVLRHKAEQAEQMKEDAKPDHLD